MYKKTKIKMNTIERNEIVLTNMGLVKTIIIENFKGFSYDERDDLIQVGYIGLIKASERFDPTLGHSFSSFASPWIKGEILHYLRDKAGLIRIPRGMCRSYGRPASIDAVVEEGEEGGFSRTKNLADVAQSRKLDLEEESQYLRCAVDKILPSNTYGLNIVKMMYIDNIPVSKISEQYNIQISTLYKIKNREIKQLQNLLSA